MDEEEDTRILAKRRFKRINRQTKVHVVFDEKARREFLTGFHKRKLQRQKKAKEELKQKFKEEKRRIKQEAKDEYKKLVKTFEPIPDLEEKLAQHYDVKNATVSILELDTDLLAENNFIIGRNRVKYEDEIENAVKKELGDDDEVEENSPEEEPKTKKEVKHRVKEKATNIIKKSSVFKKINKLNQLKQKRKSMHQKNQRQKVMEKKQRKKRKRPMQSS